MLLSSLPCWRSAWRFVRPFCGTCFGHEVLFDLCDRPSLVFARLLLRSSTQREWCVLAFELLRSDGGHAAVLGSSAVQGLHVLPDLWEIEV